MARTVDDLLPELLQLSADERAKIASSLIQSLDEEDDEDVEQQWAAEIKKRIEDIDSGKVELIPWSEVRARLTER